jgi:hypothetical protein
VGRGDLPRPRFALAYSRRERAKKQAGFFCYGARSRIPGAHPKGAAGSSRADSACAIGTMGPMTEAVCDWCSKTFDVLEATEDYTLQHCVECDRYVLSIREDPALEGADFQVAQGRPWPEGTWVRIKRP